MWSKWIFGRFLIFLCLLPLFAAGPKNKTKVPFQVPKTQNRIIIDGVLDEAAWLDALKLELKYEVRPGENTVPPVRTEMLMVYSENALLVAFKAFDPEPEKIRARFSDRDETWSDDWVGIVLDTFNDERRAYELIVNPLGAQTDALNDDVTGNYDDSWNAIWDSAGRINEHGYFVEMRIPFNQLRFQGSGSEPQIWGVDGMRSYPRTHRHHIGLFPRDRGANSYLSQEDKLEGFAGADPGRNLEIVPTFTSGKTEFADNPGDPLSGSDDQTEAGITARWGITPNLTLSGTINPDFSQVEADAVQLSINETFALYFDETRPFFLEGQDYFNTGLNLLHTRTISDPSSAIKLTGKQNRHTFGVFAAQDEVTNVLIPSSQGSSADSFDAESSGMVARYRYDFGRNSTVGALITHRQGENGYNNTVYSLDARYRISEKDRININYASSKTDYAEEMVDLFELDRSEERDEALRIAASHTERNWEAWGSYNDYGEGFRADLGFQPQVGYDKVVAGAAYMWHGTPKTVYNRIYWGADWDQTHESDGQLFERELETFFRFQGPKESHVNVTLGQRIRVYQGVEYDQRFHHFHARATPTAMFHFWADASWGDWIDFDHERAAENLYFRPGIRLNVGRGLKMDLAYRYSELDVAGGNLFSAEVPEVRMNYYFNRRAFVRAVLLYTNIERNLDLYDLDAYPDTEAESKDLLSQLLFTYKLNPQTVAYAGYTDKWYGDDQLSLTRTERTFFMKLGYAWLR